METVDFAERWGLLLLGSHLRFEDYGPDLLRRPNIRPDSELGPCVVPPDCLARRDCSGSAAGRWQRFPEKGPQRVSFFQSLEFLLGTEDVGESIIARAGAAFRN